MSLASSERPENSTSPVWSFIESQRTLKFKMLVSSCSRLARPVDVPHFSDYVVRVRALALAGERLRCREVHGARHVMKSRVENRRAAVESRDALLRGAARADATASERPIVRGSDCECASVEQHGRCQVHANLLVGRGRGCERASTFVVQAVAVERQGIRLNDRAGERRERASRVADLRGGVAVGTAYIVQAAGARNLQVGIYRLITVRLQVCEVRAVRYRIGAATVNSREPSGLGIQCDAA